MLHWNLSMRYKLIYLMKNLNMIFINILFFKVVNIHSEHLLYLTFNINDLYLFYRCWIIFYNYWKGKKGAN